MTKVTFLQQIDWWYWCEKYAQKAKDLEAIGYKTQVHDLNSGVQAIIIEPNQLVGGADPRREGRAMGD